MLVAHSHYVNRQCMARCSLLVCLFVCLQSKAGKMMKGLNGLSASDTGTPLPYSDSQCCRPLNCAICSFGSLEPAPR